MPSSAPSSSPLMLGVVTLRGPVVDQAALRGLLGRIRDLGLRVAGRVAARLPLPRYRSQTDQGPRQASLAGAADGVADRPFGIRACGDCLVQPAQSLGLALVLGPRLVVLETLRQFVGVLEDLFDAARQGHHLRNFSRPRIS